MLQSATKSFHFAKTSQLYVIYVSRLRHFCTLDELSYLSAERQRVFNVALKIQLVAVFAKLDFSERILAQI